MEEQNQTQEQAMEQAVNQMEQAANQQRGGFNKNLVRRILELALRLLD